LCRQPQTMSFPPRSSLGTSGCRPDRSEVAVHRDQDPSSAWSIPAAIAGVCP
jgi:hypothetical protein